MLLFRWLSRLAPAGCCTPWARRWAGWPTLLSPTYRRRFRGQRAPGRATLRRRCARGRGRGRPHGGRDAAPVAAPARPVAPGALGGRGADRGRRWRRAAACVFLTPHLGCFEITAQAYAAALRRAQPITVLYRPARQPWLRELMETARAAPGAGHRADHAGRRAPDDARAAAGRGGRPAARPGAARGHGRVGALLRPRRPTP